MITKGLDFADVTLVGIVQGDSMLARSLPKIPDGVKNLYIIRMDALNIDKVFERFAKRVDIEEVKYISSSLTIYPEISPS